MTGPDGAAAGTSAHRLASFILKDVSRAVRQFDMIAPGDRIAVAVSGGKDSLALLSLLLLWPQIAGSARERSGEWYRRLIQ